MPTRSGADPSSPTESLARFVTETTYDDVPPAALDTVRRSIIDTVGVTLAGLSHASSEIVSQFVTGDDELTGIPRAVGTDGDLAEYALLYGTAGHALDYDDLSWAMDGHPSVVLLPPILALAGRASPTGADVLTAYSVGFEAACHVAAPITPQHYEAGWHATATFGTFGATAAVASLLDLDVETTVRALNIAASMPAGLKANFGSMTKPLHAGLAARSGVTTALLADNGLTAGDQALDGDRGFWSLYGAGRPPEAPEPLMADGWQLVSPGIHLKRYPACYFTHSSIAAARTLVEDHAIEPVDVERIHVMASRGAGDALAYDRPETPLQSKFSMPHAVAVAVVESRVELESFEATALRDEQLAEIRQRVEFEPDDTLPYDSHGAVVTIETGTESYSEQRDHPPWTHDAPPSADALEAKFVEAATRTIPEETARTAFDRLQSLDEHDFGAVFSPLYAD